MVIQSPKSVVIRHCMSAGYDPHPLGYWTIPLLPSVHLSIGAVCKYAVIGAPAKLASPSFLENNYIILHNFLHFELNVHLIHAYHGHLLACYSWTIFVHMLYTYRCQFFASCKHRIDPCSTTGERDPVTSALLIILGRRMSLDIAQVVRWKSSPSAEILPTVCYAASFAGYVTSFRV